MMIMRTKTLRKLMEDPKAREMIENVDEVSGHLTSGWKQCTI